MTIRIPERDPCPFCLNLTGTNGCVFVHRGEHVASFVAPRQHQPGSMLVIPTAHYPSVLEIPDAIVRDVYAHARLLAAAAVRAFDASGVNVFQNNGVDAGQSVPPFHVHVVPRYPGVDPGRVFDERDAVRIDVDERHRIADAVRAVLGDSSVAGVDGG